VLAVRAMANTKHERTILFIVNSLGYALAPNNVVTRPLEVNCKY